ncbi:MAG TPA: SUMF1/EgtB/PvdO family nonheme iron enzyme [Kofleriaceae bacterium]|jgi:formylglycine-generating enzyme required for sulfatase activity
MRWTLLLLVACGGAPAPVHPNADRAPLSLAADRQMVDIAAGQYVAGSTVEEREMAYDDHARTAKSDVARDEKWFDSEEERHVAQSPAFRIDLMPVTQSAYAEFVTAGKAPPPAIDEATWKREGSALDYQTQVARFVWKDGHPPPKREDHPVVLVTWDEAAAYCAWRGELAGQPRRLPTAAEFERAARGDGGLAYPWTNEFDAKQLNSAVGGPGDTVPVGGFPASPHGALGMAGNVFQWTSTPMGDGKMMVKGSSWDDFGGVGRGASGHGRVKGARHPLVGFRCAADAPPAQ